jgi:hypothetical protein
MSSTLCNSKQGAILTFENVVNPTRPEGSYIWKFSVYAWMLKEQDVRAWTVRCEHVNDPSDSRKLGEFLNTGDTVFSVTLCSMELTGIENAGCQRPLCAMRARSFAA